jgi:hypothetical protein
MANSCNCNIKAVQKQLDPRKAHKYTDTITFKTSFALMHHEPCTVTAGWEKSLNGTADRKELVHPKALLSCLPAAASPGPHQHLAHAPPSKFKSWAIGSAGSAWHPCTWYLNPLFKFGSWMRADRWARCSDGRAGTHPSSLNGQEPTVNGLVLSLLASSRFLSKEGQETQEDEVEQVTGTRS